MKLLFPEFLYALFLLVIPIIIHLFNFRRYKTIRFSQVRFLQNIQKKTQSTSKLKHILVLLSRCLAIIALVLAFCQPYISKDNTQVKKGKNGVNIYLDNSFSMQLKGEKGIHLETAKSKALSILDAYGASDRFRILTNDFESQHNRWLSKDDFISELQDIDYSPAAKTISQVVQRMTESNSSEELQEQYYLISDLQKYQFNLDQLSDTSEINFVPLRSQLDKNYNLSQLSLEQPFHLKQQEEALNYTIKNQFKFSEDQLPVKLFLNQKLKNPQFINLPEADSINQVIRYRNPDAGSYINGKITIKDFPITFDDTLYFSYPLQQSIRLIHLYEKQANINVRTLFENDSLFDYQSININALDYSLLRPPALIIADELSEISSGLKSKLINFIQDGGTLAFFPSAEIEKANFSEFLQAAGIGKVKSYQEKEMQIKQLNEKAAIFQSVFEKLDENPLLPKVKSRWIYSLNTRSLNTPILSFNDNTDFLLKTKIGKGKLYLSASGLSEKESNLVNQAIFVPLLYNMALQSANYAPLYYQLRQERIALPKDIMQNPAESPVHLVGNQIDIIPRQQYVNGELIIELGQELRKAGHYQLLRKNEKLGTIALNYDRRESELYFLEEKELIQAAELQGLNIKILNEAGSILTNSINQYKEGIPLWKYFILLALIFIGIEILFLRLF